MDKQTKLLLSISVEWVNVLKQAFSTRSTLLGRMGEQFDDDFVRAFISAVKGRRYVAHRITSAGQVSFISDGEKGPMMHEMHMIDSETRMYGSSRSAAGQRFRRMYGDMSKDWYCVRIHEELNGLESLTALYS